MHIQRMRRRTRKGGYFYHYCVATKEGRRYLPRARLASVETQIEIEKRSRGMLRAVQDALKTGDDGRPPILNYEIRAMLTAAAYRVHGGRIFRNRKTWFTPSAIEYRYSLLDDDLKRIIKSPENLATLEAHAISRQLSYAGRGTSGKSFDDCFAEILEEAMR